MTGRLITFEGGEGAGKTTNIGFVADWLRDRGVEVLVTREPGGTPLGERLRDLLLTPEMHPAGKTELLLMFAARAQHIEERIRPALARGVWVISDRFTDATWAYQGGGRGVNPEHIRTLEHLVQDGLCPDLTFLLDLPVEQGMTRARERGALDRFEQEDMAFFRRIRDTYLARAANEPARIRVIDCSPPLPIVQQRLAQELDAAWERFRG